MAITIGLSRLQPAAPSVERAALWIDTVARGDLLHEVHAAGVLVPEHVRIIAAATGGRVEGLPATPGQSVGPSTVIVRLANPDIELQTLESEQQLSVALGGLVGLRTGIEQQRLAQQSAIAQVESDVHEAERNNAVMDSLGPRGLASANEVATARDRLGALEARAVVERKRLQEIDAAGREQLELVQDQVTRLRAIVAAQRARVASMSVPAGDTGVLQSLPLTLGQWVNPGMELARVARPGKLKAVLRVPETEARDIVVGLAARIDTRNGVVPGHVTRTDPAAANGTVTVEVALDGSLPSGTRSDLSVDGTIAVERIPNVLHVGRPAYGQPGSVVRLFRLDPSGESATRVTVRLGRASTDAVEVLGGLSIGDRVIISDMSQWDRVEHLRLK